MITPFRALGALALLAASMTAQDEKYYAMGESGRLALNGTVLDKLPGNYDPEDEADPNAEQIWVDLVVIGADRYALRGDGIVRKNGAKLFKLPWTPADPLWVKMTVVDDVVWAVRADGVVTRDKKIFAELPADGFPFVDIEIAPNGDVQTLTIDGVVFVNDDDVDFALDLRGDPLIPGPLGEPNGTPFFAAWVDIEIAEDGVTYGLRADGLMQRGTAVEGAAPPAIAITWALFPGPTVMAPVTAFTYRDFEIQPGLIPTPIAMRQDGQVYTASLLLEEPQLQVDYAGDGDNVDEIFVDFVLGDAVELEFWALRSDGRLYTGLAPTPPLLTFLKKGYVRAAVSTAAPDLSNFKNSKPLVGRYKMRALEGMPVSVPIVLSDSDKLAEDLLVSLFDDPADLDPGVTWDDKTQRLELDDTLTKGGVKARILVDDGEAKAKKTTVSVKVVPVDANVDKNKPPKLIKVKPLQALVGIPFEMELLAFDPDGDAVTITADDSNKKSIFNIDGSDAVVVEEDGRTILRWTPGFDDLGKQVARLVVTDGDKTKKSGLKIRVVSPLIF